MDPSIYVYGWGLQLFEIPFDFGAIVKNLMIIQKKYKNLNEQKALVPFTRLEKQHQSDVHQSERLASLGIMGSQFRGPLKPPVHYRTIVLSGLKGI